MTAHEPALVARAIHDVTCPEGPECRDRILHSAAQPLAHTGVLAQFLARLAELEAADDDWRNPPGVCTCDAGPTHDGPFGPLPHREWCRADEPPAAAPASPVSPATDTEGAR